MTGRWRQTSVAAVLVAAAAAGGACTSEIRWNDDGTTLRSSALDQLAGSPSPFAVGVDRWEVWVCRIPSDTTVALFADDPWRLDASPERLAAVVDDGVAQWWSQRSHGLYRPVVVAGGSVTVTAEGDDQACVAAAIESSTSTVDGVIVVATAAHREDAPGGWGRPGTCATPCVRTPVTTSGRAVYVGATDFHPSWGDHPPLDLVQHEMGHALDLPHSATATVDGRVVYESAIDVMSDSAGPRALDPDRRDGADTLGANRVALGWLPLDDVVVVLRSDDATEQQVTLAASTSAEPAPRLVVLPLDEWRLVTVEFRTPIGPDAHLGLPGISVHLVDQSPRPDDPGCSATACTGQHRVQRPLVGSPPYLDLLTTGEQIEVEGWRIRVLEVSSTTSRVALTPV